MFPYVVEIPPRGPEWDEEDEDEEGFFSAEEEEDVEDFVEPIKGNHIGVM